MTNLFLFDSNIKITRLLDTWPEETSREMSIISSRATCADFSPCGAAHKRLYNDLVSQQYVFIIFIGMSLNGHDLVEYAALECNSIFLDYEFNFQYDFACLLEDHITNGLFPFIV